MKPLRFLPPASYYVSGMDGPRLVSSAVQILSGRAEVVQVAATQYPPQQLHHHGQLPSRNGGVPRSRSGRATFSVVLLLPPGVRGWQEDLQLRQRHLYAPE